MALVLATALAPALAGCGDGADARPGAAGELWGRTFLSTAVTERGAPRPLVDGSRVRLAFTEGEVRAHAGCNQLTGRARLDGATLAVSDVAGTEMGCDPPRHEQDAWLSRFLEARPGWRLDGDELVLRAGDTELRLADRRVADPDRPLLGTRWRVESVLDATSAASVADGSAAFLTFAEGDRLRGSTGCNELQGSAVPRGDRVTFSGVTTTRRACGPELATLEAGVVAVLSGEVGVRIEADLLVLTQPGGRGLQLRAER
jgi:heat shock protein HslJ